MENGFSAAVSLLFAFKKIHCYLFVRLHGASVAARGIFSCGKPTLSCGPWGLVPDQGWNPGLLGTWSLLGPGRQGSPWLSPILDGRFLFQDKYILPPDSPSLETVKKMGKINV